MTGPADRMAYAFDLQFRLELDTFYSIPLGSMNKACLTPRVMG